MSERGSFFTQFSYCTECIEKTQRVLVENSYIQITHRSEHILGGYVNGGTTPGGEIEIFEELVPELKKTLCHSLRIVVLPETGKVKVFKIKPIPNLTD